MMTLPHLDDAWWSEQDPSPADRQRVSDMLKGDVELLAMLGLS